MFTNIRGFWGFAGVGLALVALYLVLVYGKQSAQIIDSAGVNLGHVYAVLQGRAV